MHGHLPLSFADDLEQNATSYASEPAYVDRDRQLTHGDLLARAKRLGSALYKAGARRQDRIAILAMNCIEYGEVIAATQWSAFILATVNFRLAPPEIAYVVKDGAPKVLIFEAQDLPVIETLRADMPSVQTFVCIGSSTDWAVSYDDFIATGDPAGPPLRRPRGRSLLPDLYQRHHRQTQGLPVGPSRAASAGTSGHLAVRHAAHRPRTDRHADVPLRRPHHQSVDALPRRRRLPLPAVRRRVDGMGNRA